MANKSQRRVRKLQQREQKESHGTKYPGERRVGIRAARKVGK